MILVLRQVKASWLARLGGLAAGALVLSACVATPNPLDEGETADRIAADLEEMFAEQEPVSSELSLHEAMARAILYNLDQRQRVMEAALAQRQLDLSRYDLLPQLVANGSYDGRSNFDGSVSQSLEDGSVSLEPSTSQERDILRGDLTLSWNVLDFGVSWVNTLQQADRALIAEERRRRVVHTIIQDVRSAYWRAAAAERLLDRLPPVMERIERAQADARAIEERRLQPPLEALSYQRTLLETMQQLQDLRQELILAKTQLAALINARPDETFSLVDPTYNTAVAPEVPFTPEEMETLALAYRPELREEDYQARVTANETRKALLRLLPGISLDYGLNYDTNVFLVNQGWEAYGAQVTFNLLNLFAGPANIRFAQAQEDVVVARRQALSMAILTQSHVAYISYLEAVNRYSTTNELADIDRRILDQLSAAGSARQVGDLAVIQAELNDLVGQLRRDLAFADLQNALGQIYVTIGADPLPAAIESPTVAAMTDAIRLTEQGWLTGDIYLDDGWTLDALLNHAESQDAVVEGDGVNSEVTPSPAAELSPSEEASQAEVPTAAPSSGEPVASAPLRAESIPAFSSVAARQSDPVILTGPMAGLPLPPVAEVRLPRRIDGSDLSPAPIASSAAFPAPIGAPTFATYLAGAEPIPSPTFNRPPVTPLETTPTVLRGSGGQVLPPVRPSAAASLPAAAPDVPESLAAPASPAPLAVPAAPEPSTDPLPTPIEATSAVAPLDGDVEAAASASASAPAPAQAPVEAAAPGEAGFQPALSGLTATQPTAPAARLPGRLSPPPLQGVPEEVERVSLIVPSFSEAADVAPVEAPESIARPEAQLQPAAVFAPAPVDPATAVVSEEPIDTEGVGAVADPLPAQSDDPAAVPATVIAQQPISRAIELSAPGAPGAAIPHVNPVRRGGVADPIPALGSDPAPLPETVPAEGTVTAPPLDPQPVAQPAVIDGPVPAVEPEGAPTPAPALVPATTGPSVPTMFPERVVLYLEAPDTVPPNSVPRDAQ